MKRILPIIFISLILNLASQPAMYRHFPQTQAFYATCDIQNVQQTQDKGYIFSFFPYTTNIHGPSPYDQYTIKTDSNFIPQWKKFGDRKAIVLPTGGIIIYYSYPLSPQVGTFIEKITASGVQVWAKKTSADFVLNDGVTYNNKVRFVGKKSVYVLTWAETPYTLEMDTLGNFISNEVFTVTGNTNCSFLKIKRDALGNFFVFGDYFVLAKFNSSFSFLWAKAVGSPILGLTDMDILPGGRIFATATMYYNTTLVGALLKFDSQGNLLLQNFMDRRNMISGLCKKSSGNYVVSFTRGYNDSLVMFETDTAMNISWNKLTARGTAIGTSLIKGNSLYTPIFYGSNPVLISTDLNGNSCASVNIPYTKLTSTLTLSGYTLSSLSSTAGITASTIIPMGTQNYVDSCKCSPFVQSNPVNQIICTNSSATLNSVPGTGKVSWYSTPAGNSYLSSGTQFIFSAGGSQSVATFYVYDSLCILPSGRSPVTITVSPPPSLTVSASHFSICSGQSATLNAQGAVNYSWNNSSTGNALVISPSVTTTYSIKGYTDPTCSDTKTITVTVIPFPTLTINPPQSICSGSTVTLSVTGAGTYTWSNGMNSASITVSPTQGIHSYSVTGANSNCTRTISTLIVVQPNPVISIATNSQVLCEGNTNTLVAQGANSYTWTYLSISSSGNSIAITPVSNSSVYVQGSSGVCISNLITLPVFPSPTLAISSGTQDICLGEIVNLLATGALTYSWNMGAVTSSISDTPLVNTNYAVTGLNTFGCSDTKTIGINVHPLPTLTLSSSSPSLCAGGSATLNASGAASYSWNSVNGSSSTVVSPSASAIYTVTGLSAFGCGDTKTIEINVHSLPVILLSSSNPTLCSGESAQLSASGAGSYTWIPGSAGISILVSPTVTTIYTVQGTNGDGCMASATISQQVSLCTGLQGALITDTWIALVPNPNNGFSTLHLSSVQENRYATLYNALGQVILHKKIETKTLDIDLDEQAAGIYYLIVNDGQKALTIKVIKQ